MSTNLKKKLIGTSVFALTIAGVMAVSFGYVEARFISRNDKIRVDGVVTDKTANKLTIDTNGTKPFKVQITGNTKFPGKTDYSDIGEGDMVTVEAIVLENGKLEATKVKEIDHAYGHSYGKNPKVRVKEGKIVKIDGNVLTVLVDGSKIKAAFQVVDNTMFSPGKTKFSDLDRGDIVKIRARDNGSAFIARHIILLEDDEAVEYEE